jgi:SAM-dependent methyltransferase
MIACLKPVSTAATPCKICGGHASLFGVVDFHRSCEDWRAVPLALSGVPVYYRRCADCQFLFTDAFDDWSLEDFRTHIYNDGYERVDPEYVSARPRANAEVVARLWAAIKTDIRVLDYGGGNDTFCAVLRQSGFPVAVTFDPLVPEYVTPPDGSFDLVTSFETFEHMPDPTAGIESILKFVAEPGLVFFTAGRHRKAASRLVVRRAPQWSRLVVFTRGVATGVGTARLQSNDLQRQYSLRLSNAAAGLSQLIAAVDPVGAVRGAPDFAGAAGIRYFLRLKTKNSAAPSAMSRRARR